MNKIFTYRTKRFKYIIRLCIIMVETFNVLIRKWGNSLGAVLPNSVVQKNQIKENDVVKIFVVKQNNVLKKNFGKLKGKLKLSGQEMKNMLRKELHGIE